MRNTRKRNLTLIRMLNPSSSRIHSRFEQHATGCHSWNPCLGCCASEARASVGSTQAGKSNLGSYGERKGARHVFIGVFVLIFLPISWYAAFAYALDTREPPIWTRWTLWLTVLFVVSFGDAEKTREKLSNFVQHMKTALAALTSQILWLSHEMYKSLVRCTLEEWIHFGF